MDKKTFKLEPRVDLSELLVREDEIISVSIDRGFVNVLIIHSKPQYRNKNGTSAIVKSEIPKDYSFIRMSPFGEIIYSVKLKQEFFNFNYCCFLETNEILLVCGRCRYISKTKIDKNARIYNTDGILQREFTVGDGIQDIRIDKNNHIWISYFDEGIFGNYGWDNPIGSPGLISWDKFGNKNWEFTPTEELEQMADCYAMNLDDDNNIWFYYYTAFKIVKFRHSGKLEFWDCGIKGSSSINIAFNYVLMNGGYDNEDFKLFELMWKQVNCIGDIKFKTSTGDKLNSRNYVSSDGSNVGFLLDNKLYMINMLEII